MALSDSRNFSSVTFGSLSPSVCNRSQEEKRHGRHRQANNIFLVMFFIL